MNIIEIQNKILSDDKYVEEELENFLVYYNLKHTLRWGIDNTQKDETESVAEHVYGMHILADYFLPFYPDLNKETVRQMITWHDMAEAVVDDMTTKTKTDEHRKAESEAEEQIFQNSSLHLQNTLQNVFTEYEEQETTEAQFTKAIDKVEPIFHMFFLSKTRKVDTDKFKTEDSGWTMTEYREHRRNYIESFSLIWRFDTVMTPIIDKAGFFREWA